MHDYAINHQPSMSFVKLYILMSRSFAPFMDMCGLYPTSSSLNIPIFQGSCAAGDRNCRGAAEASGATSVEASKSTNQRNLCTVHQFILQFQQVYSIPSSHSHVQIIPIFPHGKNVHVPHGPHGSHCNLRNYWMFRWCCYY